VPVTRSTAHRGRLLALALVVALGFGGLVGRLGQVQLVGVDTFDAVAGPLDTRTLVVPALRGRILDRSGRPLADNRTATVVTIERRVIADDRRGAEAEVRDVADVLGLPPEDLLGRTWLCGEDGAPAAPACWAGSPQVPVPLAEDVDPHKALTLVEQPQRFPGIAVDSVAVRVYPRPKGSSAAHVIGYLGQVTADEVARGTGLVADDLVGRAGLEQEYDAVLRGTPGRTVVSVDARGLVTGVVSRTEPVPGRDLVTSLDAAVQARAEKALVTQMRAARRTKEKWPADSGAVVVLDPRNGDVLALASAPTYDPNVWTGGISPRDYRALTSARAGTPLLSRAVDVGFAPASTIKPSSIVAAVHAGNSLDGAYACPSSLRVGDTVFNNYEATDGSSMSLRRALEVSCDTVFYDLAYRAWQNQGGPNAGTGAPDPFATTASRFGLGRKTGIDLPAESAGRVPDRAWKRAAWEDQRAELCARARSGYPEVRNTERRVFLKQVAKENCETGWQLRAGDAVNFSIGQGDLLATPLQMAVMYASIANGGDLVTPRIGQRVVDRTTGEKEVVPAGRRRAAPLTPELDRYLRGALRGVVTDGTGVGAFATMPRDWPVAGKTGTGEALGKRDTSWFVSYAPADRPRYVVAVVVGQGGHGSDTAAPVAAAVHRMLRGLR
jgi:penicillin-binding protein 2